MCVCERESFGCCRERESERNLFGVLSDTPKRLCDTTDTGKYDLLYDVIICKYKESSLKSVRGSLEEGHDFMTCLVITSMIMSGGCHSFL